MGMSDANAPTSEYGAGRYAPSPSGDLHLGNLRTAVLAYLFAVTENRAFHLRIDDIDAQRSSTHYALRQLDDLAALGVKPLPGSTHAQSTAPAPPRIVTQQQTLPHYRAALKKLQDQGLTYECYCSRKDITEAQRAPHATPGIYPGTCRDLTPEQRTERREQLAEAGRMWSVRLASHEKEWEVPERYQPTGTFRGEVDDMVLRRGGNIDPTSNDGAGGHADDFAYNLAVVVDDALAGVTQVVRGDDLLTSAPRQAYLAHLLGLPPVEYVHVPLVLGPEGKRLAKRDGAVTLGEVPGGAAAALRWIADSLGDAVEVFEGDATPEPSAIMDQMVRTFDPAELPLEPVTWRP